MPELPEVETVKRIIEPQIRGHKITDVIVNNPQVIARPSVEEFCNALSQQTITGMGRRGKFLSVHLDSGDKIILHLRMTGCLLATPQDYPTEKHTHVIFHLESGNELRFTDTRRFGRFWLVKSGEEDEFSGIHKLGMEPFNEDFSPSYLKTALAKRKKTIKECLLDQSVIAGIGNIYTDEILFAAKIRPDRTANSLSGKEWQRLTWQIHETLRLAIEKNKMTNEEYLAGKGQEYRNSPFLLVYGHDGEPCPVCGEILCRTVLAGRGCVYCPKCQEETPC